MVPVHIYGPIEWTSPPEGIGEVVTDESSDLSAPVGEVSSEVVVVGSVAEFITEPVIACLAIMLVVFEVVTAEVRFVVTLGEVVSEADGPNSGSSAGQRDHTIFETISVWMSVYEQQVDIQWGQVR